MNDDWYPEGDDPLVSDDDAPLWLNDDEIDAEIGTGETEEAEYAAWLRGLPDDIRAAYLALPSAGPLETDPAGFWHRDIEPGSAGIGFAAGGPLDSLPPGPELAGFATVTDAERAELDESALIGVLCAWQRLAAWAQAGQAATLMTLAHRREAQALELDRPSLAEHVDDEVAAALRLTCRSADQLLATAGGLDRLPDVHAALKVGQIDWPKACLFVDLLAGLPNGAARTIAADLLGRAVSMTSGQLRAALTRAVLAHDPEAAERRREEARADSSVHTWTETSGNAALAGRELAAADVINASSRLSAFARWLRKHGATETMDKLRAAVYVALLTGRPVESLLAVGTARDVTPAPLPLATGPALTGSVNLIMPMSTWLGLTREPGEVASLGPVDATTCSQLAAIMDRASRWCLTLTGPDGRAAGHACASRGPAAGQPVITWVAGLRAKLKLLEAGCCSHARKSHGYTPSDALRHLIHVRQRRCCYPGCRRPANRCDLDHTTPFDHGGLTCECNLAPLCRRHHQAKQAARWHLDQPDPGRMTWRTPSGRVYQTTGDPY
jgi:hypothetical protein